MDHQSGAVSIEELRQAELLQCGAQPPDTSFIDHQVWQIPAVVPVRIVVPVFFSCGIEVPARRREYRYRGPVADAACCFGVIWPEQDAGSERGTVALSDGYGRLSGGHACEPEHLFAPRPMELLDGTLL